MSNEYLGVWIFICIFLVAAWLQRNIGKINDELKEIKENQKRLAKKLGHDLDKDFTWQR